MCERTIYPYGARAGTLNNTTMAVGFSLVWDKATAEWFVMQANANGLRQYGHWMIMPLPGHIEVEK